MHCCTIQRVGVSTANVFPTQADCVVKMAALLKILFVLVDGRAWNVQHKRQSHIQQYQLRASLAELFGSYECAVFIQFLLVIFHGRVVDLVCSALIALLFHPNWIGVFIVLVIRVKNRMWFAANWLSSCAFALQHWSDVNLLCLHYILSIGTLFGTWPMRVCAYGIMEWAVSDRHHRVCWYGLLICRFVR